MSRRDRPILGILSILSSVSSSYILHYAIESPALHAASYDIVAATAVSSFSVGILLAWLSAGIIGGAALTLYTIIAVSLFDLRAGFYGSPVFILQFVFASAIGYAIHARATAADRACALKLEKIGEEVNGIASVIEERRKSIQALVRKMVGYSTLKGVVESFSTVLSAEELCPLILDKALETLDKRGRGLVYLVDVERQELMLTASRNETRVKEKRGDLFDRWVLRHRRSLIIEDVTRDFRFPTGEAEAAADTFTSLIAAPLISEDKTIGIVRIDSAEAGFFTQDDLRLIDIVANLGAVALQNSFLYARTQELAIRDGLTGLFVRRYFMERFGEELKRMAMKQGALAALIIDIDHFKAYNDKYGHTAGDLVLKHLSSVLGSMARDGDVVARYGGEEFVVILSGREREAAIVEAEAIRHAIADRPFQLRRHETRITASIGVACYPQDAVTEDALLAVADERLYRAKREGRDRVCAA